ncbi:Subtilase family protein [Tistlia consotensis]|uniref:Subtilase family protein n=1 Tax=Tistlia consotensis USBA 355 TaxID=560819 RepID=A0A1Y6CYP4_9PROT|nr:S8 family serine peptidase [Tistlia consotensis]SMF83482.1 Subtilase family protein [Tistlia consotensis USBA 355]SNS33935.1 Subtilase family protein [Tistlia consotensis]
MSRSAPAARLLPRVLAGLLLAAPALAGAPEGDASGLLRQAVVLGCPEGGTAALLGVLPGARLVASEAIGPEAAPVGRRERLALAGGGALVLERLAPGGILRRFTASYEEPHGEGTRPRLLALADGGCRIVQGRALDWHAFPAPDGSENGGGPDRLVLLAADLTGALAAEPLDPPVPPGRDPEGVTVAQVDAGVAYDLPAIAGRLARDAGGEALGYDWWDLDPRPYDANPAVSPFFPARHGTEVAGLLLAEAPGVRLVPYRYPRPDMGRMAAVVEAAARAGAGIVALPMGSNSRDLWEAFLAAAGAHPEMLFVVSAGNDGRDIDERPVWPAAAGLDNLLTVTSSEADGRLAPGSNWGAESVDLLVPAERQAVVDYRGRPHLASGSSFAVPRIAALAARLKARHPDWQAAALKRAILALAEPPPRAGLVKAGWIRDPLAAP